MTQTMSEAHPIGLIVDDDLQRNRLTVFFRLLLAIPQLIWLGLWGILVYFAVIVAWFAAGRSTSSSTRATGWIPATPSSGIRPSIPTTSSTSRPS